MLHAKLVVVQTCGNRLEADLAKNTLEAEGIQAMVQADTAGGMREHLAWSGMGFKIFVREEDEAAAADVLTQTAGPLVDEGDASIEGDFPPDSDGLPPRKLA